MAQPDQFIPEIGPRFPPGGVPKPRPESTVPDLVAFPATPTVEAGLPLKEIAKLIPVVAAKSGKQIDSFAHFLGFTINSPTTKLGVNKLLATWLLPQPLGVTPPTYLGIPENYIFGRTPAEALTAIIDDLIFAPVTDAQRLQRRDREAATIAQLRASLGLNDLTTPELLAALGRPAFPGASPEENAFVGAAIQVELASRPASEIDAAFAQLAEGKLSIFGPTQQLPQDASIVWPGEAGGFIDGLLRNLPADP